MKKTLNVDLGARSYDIIIAPQLLKNSKIYLDPIIAGRRVAVFSDKIVSKKYIIGKTINNLIKVRELGKYLMDDTRLNLFTLFELFMSLSLF